MEKGGQRDSRRDIKTAVSKKNVALFTEGAKIEAKDHQGDKWWEAKVIEVDSEHSEVLVHFIGWNERHDEWIKMDSPRLQQANRNSRRHSGTDPPAQKGPNPGSAAHIKEFKTGEEVMALWAKNTKYPAKIIRFEPDGSYLVEFYDGFKKHLRPQNIRRIQPEDLPFIAACKEDVKLFKTGRKTATDIKGQDSELEPVTSTELDVDAPGSSLTAVAGSSSPLVAEQRRERKSKFSVKDIFSSRKQHTGTTLEAASNPGTPERISENGMADLVGKVAVRSGSLSEGRRSSLVTKSNEVKPENNGKAFSPILSGDTAASQVVSGERRPEKATANNFSRSRGGGPLVKRRGVGRPPKREKDSGDRNGNSPQGAVDSCINCDISPANELEDKLTALVSVGPDGDVTGSCRVRKPSCQGKTGPMTTSTAGSEMPAAVPGEPCYGAVSSATDPLELDGSMSSNSILAAGINHVPETVDTGSEGTPSEKENLPACAARQHPKDDLNAVKSNAKISHVRPRLSSSLIKDGNGVMHSPLGGGDSSARIKRSRKRKRFADEEPEGGNFSLILQPATAAGGPDGLCKAVPGVAGKAARVDRMARNGKTADSPRGAKSSNFSLFPTSDEDGRSNNVLSAKKLALLKSRHPALVMSPHATTSEKRLARSRPVVHNSNNTSPADVSSFARNISDDPAIASSTSVASSDSSNKLSKVTDTSLLAAPCNNNTDDKGLLADNDTKHQRQLPPLLTNGDCGPPDVVEERYFYRKFDFSLPPDELASKLVEGVNIPGSGLPILIEAPKLPPGWSKKVSVRSNGVNVGKWDVLIENPAGQSFKSKQDLSRHFEANDLEFNIEDFDFMLDPILKRLRQIWKANQRPSQQLPQPPDFGGNRIMPAGDRIIPYELLGSTPPSPLQSQFEAPSSTRLPVGSETPKSKVSRSPQQLQQTSPSGINATPSSSLPGEIGSAERAGKSRGVRCPLKNCDKLFRSEYLLMMHVKHYHSDYYHLVGNSPSVTDMAFHRTRLGESLDKEFETGGEILEALRKAEAREENKQQLPAEGSVTNNRNSRSSRSCSTPSRTLNKRKPLESSTSAQSNATPPPPLIKRLKVSQEECGELSISIPEVALTNVADVVSPAPKRGASDGAAVVSPVFAAGGSVVRTALPTTPLTSFVGGPASLRRRSKTDSSSSDPPQVLGGQRSRQDSMMSVGSESATAASTPPASPASGTPPQWRRRRMRTPPSELAAAVPEPEVMSEEEIVVCLCGKMDGDGLMVQCDLCLTWQHGSCLNILTEDQVPEKYICGTCRNPRLGRSSQLYDVDQDWIKEGQLPTISPLSSSTSQQPQEQQLQELGRLMAELSALSSVLHALQVKLSVAVQPTHPKVFMWSAPWEGEEEGAAEQDAEEEEVWPSHQELMHRRQQFPLQFSQPGEFSTEKARSDLRIGDEALSIGDDPTVSCEPLVRGPEAIIKNSPISDVTSAGVASSIVSNNASRPRTDTVSASPPPLGASSASHVDEPATLDSGKKDKDNQPTSLPSISSAVADNQLQESTVGDDSSIISDPTSSSTSGVDPFSFFDFPSLNEVKELLPSVLKDISCMEALAAHQPTGLPAPPTGSTAVAVGISPRPAGVTVIPEPKLIDREESRLNLIGHIEHLQELVEQRLDSVEQRLDSLQPPPDCSNIAQALARLLTDIQSMKKVNTMMPDRV